MLTQEVHNCNLILGDDIVNLGPVPGARFLPFLVDRAELASMGVLIPLCLPHTHVINICCKQVVHWGANVD